MPELTYVGITDRLTGTVYLVRHITYQGRSKLELVLRSEPLPSVAERTNNWIFIARFHGPPPMGIRYWTTHISNIKGRPLNDDRRIAQ